MLRFFGMAIGVLWSAEAAPAEPGLLRDPVLEIGAKAIDPVGGALAGRQNLTARASASPTKEALAAVPGFGVVQAFPGFEGAVKSPVNRVEFSDGRPGVTLTINSNVGWGGCASGPGEKTAYTSGTLPPKLGDSIYIGDNVNDAAYSIAFDAPVAAAGFTITRTLPTSGPSPQWTATFLGADGTLLSRQTVTVSQGPDVAVLFGHIATEGKPIAKVVFGKHEQMTPFVMGNAAIFLDDLGFAPVGGDPVRAGLVANPTLSLVMGGEGAETIDIQANGASPRSFLESIDGFGVVQDWIGFRGLKSGGREVVNTLDFAQGLDFRFRLQVQRDGADGCGGVTEDPALVVSSTNALRVGGGGGSRRLEIVAGVYDASTGTFIADAAVYAAGLVVSNRSGGDLVVTFYNQAGEVLSVQSGAGALDPANGRNSENRRGAEIYFGLIASSKDDPTRWIQRIRIDDRSNEEWGLDDFGFVMSP
jgi:hypothetical protein